MTHEHKLLEHAARVRMLLARSSAVFASVLPEPLFRSSAHLFDFSDSNAELAGIDLRDTDAFTHYITTALAQASCQLGIGRYAEDRIVYRTSTLFNADGEPRSVHLAIDLFVPASTPIYSPLPARVHSFQVNDHFLDYGPTIILEHNLDGVRFYTLYGHLSPSSLEGLSVGRQIVQGQQIAAVGQKEENGHWPPHLHFQIIAQMLGKTGDFPGVARPSEREYWLALCPDPNLILGIASLRSQ